MNFSRHHSSVVDLKEKFVILLEQLHYQIQEWENIVERLEQVKKREANA
ncbi:unnamed protein product [Brugia pahangi]|uniref:Uncharacterized protein n=1 Tax=Brugia pahangi TaxID=6280 RepID=A0A3P7U6H9_BRUPA|nr:unnamed protein product [Brugia pahangi]